MNIMRIFKNILTATVLVIMAVGPVILLFQAKR